MATLFEQVGGEPQLRAIIERFVDRIFDDVMIGFLFVRADRRRVKDKEYEFAAAHLGADVKYTGRPLQQAHAAHPILGGHFMRRLELLKQTLAEFSVPQAVVEHWVRHTEALRSTVTTLPGSDCTHSAPSAGSRSEDLVDAAAHKANTPRRELRVADRATSSKEPSGS